MGVTYKADNSGYLSMVQSYAERWRTLLAWGAHLPMVFKVETHKGQRVLGWARPGTCATVIRCTGRLARDLTTVLHEMAHLAVPNSEGHGERWRTMFVRAAAEAFRSDVDMFDIDMNYHDIDQQVIDAAETWLETR
jgi:hypothetical protein